ncbi:isocitrate lyase/PEP mutase family protein [Laceyella putida]|uniref:Isocitrate lyase/phosphoenolpyruvate mutase family protein n=1 Tax=Laceyella putida TaxID=110101 RepID=A0ABW2RQ47_9BACL
MSRENKTSAFHALHHGESLFLLPNAWDVISAKMYELAGHQALGTTSAGIAAALGYADGEKIPFHLLLETVDRMVTSVNIPVSVDLESGYASNLRDLLANVQSVVDIGAVGINIEDTADHESKDLVDANRQAEKILAIKEQSASAKAPLFINARIDTYWNNKLAHGQRLEETIHRGIRYGEAGADCIFIPGVFQVEEIRILAREIGQPINLLLGPSTPPIETLEELGVKRLSVGSGPARSVIGYIQRIATALHAKDFAQYQVLSENQIPYPALNELLDKQ